MPADGTRDHEEFLPGSIEHSLQRIEAAERHRSDRFLNLAGRVAELEDLGFALKTRVDALEARMDRAVMVETSEELMRRVYGEPY